MRHSCCWLCLQAAGAFDGCTIAGDLVLSATPTLVAAGHAFAGLEVNGVLDLSANGWTSISSLVLANVTVGALDLGANPIASIDTDAFLGFRSHSSLDLSGLGIQAVSLGAFRGMHVATHFLLSDNAMTVLPGTSAETATVARVLASAASAPAACRSAFCGAQVGGTLDVAGTPFTALGTGWFDGLVAGQVDIGSPPRVTTVESAAFRGLTLGGSCLVSLASQPVASLAPGTFTGVQCEDSGLLPTVDLSGTAFTVLGPASMPHGLGGGAGDTSVLHLARIVLSGLPDLVEIAGPGVFTGLTVGTIEVTHCTSLARLGPAAFSGATITGNLDVSHNPSLASLDARALDGVHVAGTLDLRNNIALA